MESLFRKVSTSQLPAPNNRKYASLFVALRMIKLQFKLSNIKASDRFFKVIDLAFTKDNFSLGDFSDKFRVNYANIKGKFFMYSGEF